jgi:hypothetical protein
MAIKFNEEGVAEVIPDPKKRGRKRQPRAQESALGAVSAVVEAITNSDSSGDAWIDAANNISTVLQGKSVLDETVLRELKNMGYDIDKISKNPQFYAPILTGLQDSFKTRTAGHSESIGEHSGQGVVGKHTVDRSNDGRQLRKGETGFGTD